MQEEQDTCRICSAPAEPGQPLFHPCKCSGTIRYIHQDCLTTWLAHSKKKTCDVCKYPYSFKKVYAKDMPPRLPPLLVLRRLTQQVAVGILFGIRTVMVAFIWLIFLPWATIWTWRMYFAVGDSTAWWISNRPRPTPPPIHDNTSLSTQHNVTMEGVSWPIALLNHPAVRTISADIVSGQIISTVIVMAFVSVFLLREWISQNARPGVFDDAEGPPEPEAPDPAAVVEEILRNPAVLPPQPPQGFMEDAIQDVVGPAPRDMTPSPEPLPLRGPAPWEIPDYAPGPTEVGELSDDDRDVTPPFDKGKGKAKRVQWDDSGSPSNPRKRRHSSPSEELRFEEDLYKPIPPFVPPDAALPADKQDPRPFKLDFSSWDPLKQPAAPSRLRPDVPEDISPNASPTLPLTPSRLGRPPLFSTAGFAEGAGTSSPRILGSISSRGQTPLGSPSLATYRAPEEFEAGPSNPTGYFPKPTEDEKEVPASSALENLDLVVDEYDKYFPLRQPTSSEGATYAGSENGGSEEGDDSEDMEMPPLSHWTDEEWDEEEAEAEAKDDENAEVPFHGGPEDLEQNPEVAAAGVLRQRLGLGEGDNEDVNQRLREDLQRLRDNVQGLQENAQRIQEGLERIREGVQDVQDIQDAEDPGDDLEVAMEDDMEGALEAIGLRGPVHTVLQNAALMVFVLDTAIGVGVWLPFTIGKSLALLSLDPRRLLFVLHSPIRAIRLLTDPVVDSFMFLISRLVVPPALRLLGLCVAFLTRLLSSVIGQQSTDKTFELSSALFNRTTEFVNNTWTTILSPSEAPAASAPTFLDKLLAPESPFMRVVEPYFAPLGQALRLTWSDLQESWVRLALGNGTTEKMFAISLGYMVDAVILALYLNVFSVGSMKSAGRAIRTAVRQQLLVVKVAVFIIVELVIFPLGCGITLDICTVALFPQGSLRERLTFLTHAPLTSAFYHWVLGTMFMYQFAVLLAGFRTCLRPGALWFIKDPQDQNFHPIREILDRPALTHVRKLILSGLMYGLVIMCSVGTIATILRIFSGTIMPFRWKLREPLSVVPIDLVFLHLVLPYTLQYFRPRKFLKQYSAYVWKFLAAQLRLTSYMFGDPYSKDERHGYRIRIFDDAEARGTRGYRILVLSESPSGTFRRVPNSDNIALVKDQPATVEVLESGMPVNAKEARLMLLQNLEAERAKRNIKDDYYIAYIPPYFRYRVFTFVGAIWVLCSVALAAAFVIPILIGRGFFGLLVDGHVHDGYSFLAGFYLLWACVLVSSAIGRMERHRQRRGGDEERADLALYFAKRSLLWVAQATYMAFALGVVIPTLIAIVVELYLILPARHTFNPDMRPKIRIVDMWALGLIYTKVLLRIQRMRPQGEIGRGVNFIRRNGWTHMNPMKATTEVIAPLTAGLLGMIFLPPAIIWVVDKVFHEQGDSRELYTLVYPFIFSVAAAIQLFAHLLDAYFDWQATVRDKEFLVEMRLQNLEPEQAIAKLYENDDVDATPGEEDELDVDMDAEVDAEVED